ncbi:MAG: orotate phosphoribosyltransferase [Beijerinckiaceae bacterium]|nr:orotate phosphoribosyltransferase [Beijerinckiaceae bacterium]
MSDNAQRDRLAGIIFNRSFGRGKVILASGKESDFYFDMKPTMLDPEGASLIAHQLFDAVKDIETDYVGGLEMGAVPITGGLCQVSFEKGRPIRGFFVRKQAKGHGAKKLVEGLTKDETLKGKKLIIVEDVTTTGESAFKAIEACREAGATVILVISIVDRQDGAAEFFKSRGINFTSLYQASDFLNR